MFSSHLSNYSGLGIHKRLREERQRRGHTLRQVAERAGLSEAKLSQLENGRVIIDLAELRELAAAMELPLAKLLPQSEERHYYIHRGEEVRLESIMVHELAGLPPGAKKHHNSFKPLAEPFVGRHLEPWLVGIDPLDDDKIHFIQHDYEEFMFVLHGEMEFILKSGPGSPVRERLSEGDSLYFRSCLPHCMRSASEQRAESLHVMLSLGGVDADDGRYSASGRGHYRRVVDDSIMKEAADKIGLLRQAHGLTLTELADELGVGVRRLAQVEKGEKPADMELLLRLSKKFWRPIEYFYSTSLENKPHYFIQRGSQIGEIRRQSRGALREQDGLDQPVHVYRPLASGFADRGMHPCYVQILRSLEEPLRPYSHHGEEFIFVLDGEIELATELKGKKVTEVLHAGDSIYLDSSLPHVFRSRSRNPLGRTKAEVIDVFFSPLGERYLFEAEG